MKKPNVSVTDRDLRILEFIWKWKVATTAALARRFFPDSQPMTAYCRLWQLKLGGFIQWKPDARAEKFVWGLTTKGFNAIRDSIGIPLREDGFASEHVNHDLLVSAVHLGDWLLGEPKGVCLFSEQQLRRYSTEYLPSWIPEVQSHRPDGYWYVPEGHSYCLTALEVEITLKQVADYERVGRYYNRQENLNAILWVVQRPWMAAHIYAALTRGSPQRHANHSFVFVKDFINDGWLSEIQIGFQQGKTIHELLFKDPTNVTQNGQKSFLPTFVLDARKSPVITRPSLDENENAGPHSRADSLEGGI